VRYYTRAELRRLFEETIGNTRISTDCYFSLGWQYSDYKFMRGGHKLILLASEGLRRVSDFITPMQLVADNLYCEATKEI
jgi:hypothetical protein